MSPLHGNVEAAGLAGVRRKLDPTNITADDFFRDSDTARDLFARLINAESAARIAIIPAASYGIATVCHNLQVSRPQNVVIAAEQFPANVLGWQALCARAGAELRVVERPEWGGGGGGRGGGEAREWNERILEAIDAATAVVSLGTIHWTDGTRWELESIGARAREVGAVFVLDGTQSVGALPLDVQRLRPDALICAGYKWLLGPYGLGCAYYGPRFDHGQPLEETWTARVGSDDFRALVEYRDAYRPGAVRYDVGERSSFHLTPMLVAALELLLEWRPERIQAYCADLISPLVEAAVGLGYTLAAQAWRAAHLFGLRAPPGTDLERVRSALERRRVIVSLRGNAVRVAPHVYNDAGDVAALIDALTDA